MCICVSCFRNGQTSNGRLSTDLYTFSPLISSPPKQPYFTPCRKETTPAVPGSLLGEQEDI